MEVKFINPFSYYHQGAVFQSSSPDEIALLEGSNTAGFEFKVLVCEATLNATGKNFWECYGFDSWKRREI